MHVIIHSHWVSEASGLEMNTNCYNQSTLLNGAHQSLFCAPTGQRPLWPAPDAVQYKGHPWHHAHVGPRVTQYKINNSTASDSLYLHYKGILPEWSNVWRTI